MTFLKSKRGILNLDDYSTKLEAEFKFLNVSGDMMNGDLNMQNHRILNLPDPIEETEPCSKKYCEANFLSSTGNAMKGDLNMQRNKIINLPEPTSSAEACTKKYCDDRLANHNPFSEYLIKSPNCIKLKTNICMDGKKITNLAKPTDLKQAATKEYVDETIPKIITFRVNTHQQSLNVNVNKVLLNVYVIDDKFDNVTDVNQLIITLTPRFGNICITRNEMSVPDIHISSVLFVPRNNVKSLKISFIITSCSNSLLRHFILNGHVIITPNVQYSDATAEHVIHGATEESSSNREATQNQFRSLDSELQRNIQADS